MRLRFAQLELDAVKGIETGAAAALDTTGVVAAAVVAEHEGTVSFNPVISG